IQEAIEKGKLREDLYYRLKVFQLSLPALRERREDVPLLARWFLDEFTRAEGTSKRFTDAALGVLGGYAWPGNVRELRNVVHSAYILSGPVIAVDSRPADMHPSRPVRPPSPATDAETVTVTIGMPIAEVEQHLIMATLRHCEGNKAKAAEMLGVSLKT